MRSMLVGLVVVMVLVAGCTATEKPAANKVKAVEETTAAPKADTGSIDGTVVDSEVLPIRGVAIILFDGGGKGQDLRATTTDLGKFAFNDLQPGSYRILADLSGYESVTQTVDVAAGEATDVQFTLLRVVVRIVRADYVSEHEGTVQGPVVAFQGPNGREDTLIPFPVEEWPLAIYANLTWPCGTACIGPPETNYMNMEIIAADGVIQKRCTQESDIGNNKFLLSCKLDSYPNSGEYKADVFAWEGRDVKWKLLITVDY